jgi:hypothetical protein
MDALVPMHSTTYDVSAVGCNATGLDFADELGNYVCRSACAFAASISYRHISFVDE